MFVDAETETVLSAQQITEYSQLLKRTQMELDEIQSDNPDVVSLGRRRK